MTREQISAFRRDADMIANLVDRVDVGARSDFRAARLGIVELARDAALRADITAAGLEITDLLITHQELRGPVADLRCVEDLVNDAEASSDVLRSLQELGSHPARQPHAPPADAGATHRAMLSMPGTRAA